MASDTGVSIDAADFRGLAPDHVLGNVFTDCAVGLELRFAEPLIQRRLVREVRMHQSVATGGGGLGAVEAGLDVEQLAGLRRPLRIDDIGNGAAGAGDGGVCRAARVSRSAKSILTPKSTDTLRTRLPRAFRIAARVADHDEVAAAPDHLVHAEVLKMASVGQVDEPARRRGRGPS
jgi:hypothetical protein